MKAKKFAQKLVGEAFRGDELIVVGGE